MAMQIDGLSARIGETPIRIVYTSEWPFGRVEFPEGGLFIREYGRSAPYPEALAQIEQSEHPTVVIAPVAVPQSAAVPAYTAIGGKGFPYWSVPEQLMEARAERGPSPPYEMAYLVGLGKSTGAFSKARNRRAVL
jgi:hypothetical protein